MSLQPSCSSILIPAAGLGKRIGSDRKAALRDRLTAN